MKKIRGTFLSIPVLLLANAPALWKLIDINSLLKTLIIILFAIYTLVLSEWHCADSGFGTSGENTVVCYSVIHLVHTACELHSVQKILQGSEK